MHYVASPPHSDPDVSLPSLPRKPMPGPLPLAVLWKPWKRTWNSAPRSDFFPLRSLGFSRPCKQVLLVKTRPHGHPRSVILQDDWAESDVRKGRHNCYSVMYQSSIIFLQVTPSTCSDNSTRRGPSRFHLTRIFSFTIRIYS